MSTSKRPPRKRQGGTAQSRGQGQPRDFDVRSPHRSGAAKPSKPRRSDLQSDETKRLQGPLGGALGQLQPVQRDVLQMRMGLVDGHPHTLADTAEALGLSLADAKDIEARAMEHLREVVPLDRLAKLLED